MPAPRLTLPVLAVLALLAPATADASHGTNLIRAGGGNDYVKAHGGKGIIDCGAGKDVLYVSRRAQKSYKIRNCDRISHKTLGC